MRLDNLQISNKRIPIVLAVFVLILIAVFIYINPKKPHQDFYLCNPSSSYLYNFDTAEWAWEGCNHCDCCFEFNPPGYCSRAWSFKHPMGGTLNSSVCAMQICEKINGAYECQKGFSLNQLIDNATVGDTTGWITMPCFEDLIDEEACLRQGGMIYFVEGRNLCHQLDATRDWTINNESDCSKSGGIWTEVFDDQDPHCVIPQNLLVEINPEKPSANCSVEGEEACAVLRWLKRPAGSTIRMVTLNIGQK